MMKKTLFSFLILNIAFSGISLAEGEQAYRALIENYMQAIASQNDTEILRSWNDLKSVPEAQIYMEKQFPLTAYSFKMMEANFQLETALKKYQDAYPDSPILSGASSTKSSVNIQLQTNETAASTFPNQDQPSQQTQVEREQKAGLITNQSTAATSLNQEQPSNTDLIRQDLKRMGLGN